MGILDKIFGDANEKYIKSLQPTIDKVNALEPEFQGFSADQFTDKTKELQERLAKGEVEEDILPEAFALVREAARQTLNQFHYDVQIIGALVLHSGQIAEMRTGEGKTLTATLAVYLNALSGKGVHVVTVNDYLAKRDAAWMGQVYSKLGLSVGIIQHEKAFIYSDNKSSAADEIRDIGIEVEDEYLEPCSRKEAYAADITYGTNNEFGFDYLKDNMVMSTDMMVQRPLNYAIVDEVDSILIDEARTPLIISAPAEDSTKQYYQFTSIVKQLSESSDYNVDEKMRAVTLTEEGISKVENILGVDNIYETKGLSTVHHLEQALKARVLFTKDKDYVVKDGEVIIIDEFTGRMMHGRRYSEGLHQAIEAKENVEIQRESLTLATVTFQNFFRMYDKLAGMTGTAATEAEEFSKIYNLDVSVIPTNKPILRKDTNDVIYQNEIGKFNAIIQDIKRRHKLGQPILVGTISIEKNELLGELLSKEGVPFELLNAKQHEKEAQIIAQAGRLGAVTIATNMAGRGVDIVLGGNPVEKEEAEKVKAAGGLHVIGTERHESRRIDNQLRGRSGRQGDPGSTQFFVCMEDDLMRIFGSERMKSIMQTLKLPEDMPIENGIISKSIESAQKKVEGNNFDIRKHLVEYDDVINKHREVIYTKRKAILDLAETKVEEIEIENENKVTNLKEYILDLVSKEIDQVVTFHTNAESDDTTKEIIETIRTIFPLSKDEIGGYENILSNKELETHELRDKIINHFNNIAEQKYALLETSFKTQENGEQQLRQLELAILLRTIDNLWIEHLEAIDHLRRGIGLRGYGQRDPLVEYKKESYIMFSDMIDSIQNQVVYNIFKLGQTSNIGGRDISEKQGSLIKASAQTQFAANEEKKLKPDVKAKVKDKEGHKVGRNDPCPCGSGKKYKKCHG
ncbi:preprotein translocase subunit SecA [Patescibacteria group bacterium]|nr:preprotein translocase subunit SecA [Patescibacteria group bacterium]